LRAPGEISGGHLAPSRDSTGHRLPLAIGEHAQRALRRIFLENLDMPRGDKSSYTDRQKRMAEHIEEGYEKRGVPDEEAERRAWATVNKETGGGQKSGSGKGKPENHEPARKGGRIGGAHQGNAERSAAAKKGWETRRKKSAS